MMNEMWMMISVTLAVVAVSFPILVIIKVLPDVLHRIKDEENEF